MQTSILDFYRQPGPFTDPGEYRDLLSGLPDDLPGLVKALQGLVVHIFWAQRYGLTLTPEREGEVQIRPAAHKLARLLELDPRPLNQPRPLERKLVGNCRDFSVLLATFLKAKGYPARARCGFGTYFRPGRYEDHWMVEVWNEPEGRWQPVDGQLDATQIEALGIHFNPLDMPAGQFVTGGAAWKLARAGQADPDCFGIFEWKGMDFIRGNVVRDLLALNRIEMLPWDGWGLLEHGLAEGEPGEAEWLDYVADRITADDEAHEDRLALYANTPALHAPAGWLEASKG
jgi:hypothetical protein